MHLAAAGLSSGTPEPLALLVDVGSRSLSRDQTQAPALGTWSLSHWTIREVPDLTGGW